MIMNHYHYLSLLLPIQVVHAIPKLQIEEIGEKSTFSYRVQAKCKEQKNNVSMWHDIKLFPTPDSRSQNIVNMINEIPRCSRKKYEIATNEPGNPIKQDVKKGIPIKRIILGYNN